MARAITRPSLKIAQNSEKLDISGPKTYQKPIANISVRFERKKIWLKNEILLWSKMATLEAPGHHVWAWMVERVFFSFFRRTRNLDQQLRNGVESVPTKSAPERCHCHLFGSKIGSVKTGISQGHYGIKSIMVSQHIKAGTLLFSFPLIARSRVHG